MKGTKSSAFIPEFVEYVINHLKSSDHYKERGGANQANAKDWIRRKEKDSEGIESLHDHFEQCKSDLELKLKADKPTESGIPLRAAEGLGVPASPPHQEVTRDNHVARLRVKYQISKMNPQRDAEIKSECEKFGVDFEKEVKPPIPNQ